jgi:ribosomal protein S27AE
MRQTHVYKVDLTKINGNGEFSCPRCGAIISPDDEREETYSIIGSKANDKGLEEVVIRCNKCSSHIHLTGFSLLNGLSEKDEESSKNPKEASIYYISHV